MQNKKILFIINGLGYGGAETQLLRLTKALLYKDGFSISILTITKDLALLPQMDKRINHINIPLNKNISLISNLFKIQKFVKLEQPDVIHAHLFQANILSRILKFFNHSVKVINTTHCIYDNENVVGLTPYKLYKITQKYVDFHTAVSQEALQKLLSLQAISEDKSAFIPNGLFVDSYFKENKIHNNFRWITIGRLIPVKNYTLLIKSFKEIRKFYPDFVLDIAGDGVLRSSLKQLIIENKLENNINLIGIIQDVPNLLSQYDAFVISSTSEGLPMVLLEAMSAKLPVISTDVGEIGEILNMSKGGWLSTSQNQNELINNLLKLMQLNKDELNKMGINNYNYVKKNYDIIDIKDNWIKIYNK